MMDTRVWNAQNFSIMSVIKHNCCLVEMQTRMVWKACVLFTHVAIKVKALMKYSPRKTTYLNCYNSK